ncbi:MAG: leucine-rich repeat domain-containing protein, partial [Eubacteriales bacterium]|nr:leucine-rich repeat domain-containing protein [Eubacteriales bacterium]
MSTFSASDAPFEYTFESSEEETGAVLTRYLGSENASGEPERILTVPAQIDGFPVLAVGEGAFSENGGALEEIRVPGTVRSIRENAFEYCFSLRTLILKNGVEHLGANFIGSCPQMTSLALPASIHRIDRPGDLGSLRLLPAEGNASYQYDGYGLYRTMSSDTAPAPCASVLITVSQQDDRTEYRVAPGTVCIGANAFAGQSHLRRVILPDSLREIGPSAFCQCQSLSNVVFSEGLLSIGDEAFSACPSLKSLSLPASLCEIGRCALDTSGWDDREDGLREITLRHVPQPDTNTPRQTPQPGTNTP